MTQIETIARHAPGALFCLDNDLKFSFANRETIEIAGMKNEDQLLGKQYGDMNCATALLHDEFCALDSKSIQSDKGLTSMSIAIHADGNRHVMLGSKTLQRNAKGEVAGVISHYQEVTDLNLINLNAVLSSTDCAELKKSGQISLEITYFEGSNFRLSKAENEVLFYALRGKTASEIGKKTFRSKRTIERHLDSIKIKMNCQSKPEMIEKAIEYGFMSQLPPELAYGRWR